MALSLVLSFSVLQAIVFLLMLVQTKNYFIFICVLANAPSLPFNVSCPIFTLSGLNNFSLRHGLVILLLGQV